MSFDRPARNALARMVGQGRERLRLDVMDQLRRLGFQADGGVLDLGQIAGLSEAERIASSELRALLAHFIALEGASEEDYRQGAYNRLVREIGFTTFNRLVALRMAEERGLVVQSVGRGLASDGFQVYERVANGALGTRVETYRAYLECLYDELALDLPLLFDRSTPESRIFPGERCLEDVLGLLNDPELAHLWREDEAIGWVYQYYNDPEERRRMREAGAPQNSRELAVRNQFFTPRYVVELLVDNTLGRLWYEMRLGQTRLKEVCRHLVVRPNEAVSAPRTKKDPRDLKVLDPACGSGHFLLYAFDLLEVMYEEAWGDDDAPASQATGRRLRHDYPDLDELRREVPGLVLQHNLHGVDIDPRACQIAAAALWLRAQRSYARLSLRPAERPPLTRGNIVVAEPMPGERHLLGQFVSRLEPPLVGGLVKLVFERMQLAGEAGTLLKIEEDLRDAISEAREVWLRLSRPQQLALLPEFERRRADQLSFLDTSGITDEAFWQQVEQSVFDALRAYAAEAVDSHGTPRRLFADDAIQGFAFVDVCRRRYDVVLMNPPFGAWSVTAAPTVASGYSDCRDDIDAAFLRRGASLLGGAGFIGAITNRTEFFKPTLEAWRSRFLLSEVSIETLADLGYGVLDGALVEAAALVLRMPPDQDQPAYFFRLLKTERKGEVLLRGIQDVAESGAGVADVFELRPSSFRVIPGGRISYWASQAILQAFTAFDPLHPNLAEVQFGASTKSDFRFLRLVWEVDPGSIQTERRACSIGGDWGRTTWAPVAKGGEYSPYFGDIHLVADWTNDGQRIEAYLLDRYPYLGTSAAWILHPESNYFAPGITFTRRTTSGFSPRLLQGGCVFTEKGLTAFPRRADDILWLLGVLMSRVVAHVIELLVVSADAIASGSAARSYDIAVVGKVPIPEFDEDSRRRIESATAAMWQAHRDLDAFQETSRYFTGVRAGTGTGEISRPRSLLDVAEAVQQRKEEAILTALQRSWEVEQIVRRTYQLEQSVLRDIEGEFGVHPEQLSRDPLQPTEEQRVKRLLLVRVDEIIHEQVDATGGSRVTTKKAYFADRRTELLSAALGRHPSVIIEARRRLGVLPDSGLKQAAIDELSYALGVAFGRWDVRLAQDPWLVSNLPGPSDPLPVLSPAMLVDPDGLHATSGRITSEEWVRARAGATGLPQTGSAARPVIADEEYPVCVAWDGILVDDPEHADDVVRRVEAALAVLWGDRAEAVEEDACESLGVRSLRDYFRRPTGFFADHLKRYSKSRRQAPIYWPISTGSGSYTLWVYYDRLTSDTLYTGVNRYVEPKTATIERELREAEGNLTGASGRTAASLREQVEAYRAFAAELRDFRDELLRVAALPYRPNRNDGAVINAAPMHKLFRLPKWAKDTREIWARLEKGDYDWTQLAYTIWPQRVREKCRGDRSLAIAHDLEHMYVAPTSASAFARRRAARVEMEGEEEV